ncbi:MAG: PIN domain-containing protein [Bacillota bacterium]|nr:PIN domain-containing protein [Bacillota bacterium]
MGEAYVLDSFAVLALLGREVGSEEVARLLRQAEQGKARLLMTWVNVGEVAYVIERRFGRRKLAQVLATLEATSLEIVSVAREMALAAARIKAEHSLAYADAFAAALAVRNGAALVTGDEVLTVLEGTLRIHWLRREK